MSEAVKGFIYSHGEVNVGPKKLNKYLVGIILLTDTPIDGITDEGENIAMGSSNFHNAISEALSSLPKYKAKCKLGDAVQAFLTVSELTFEDLTQIYPVNTNEELKE
jgi:hypothetical protein